MIVSTEIVRAKLSKKVLSGTIEKKEYRQYRYPALFSEGQVFNSDILYVATYSQIRDYVEELQGVHLVILADEMPKVFGGLKILLIENDYSAVELLYELQEFFDLMQNWFDRMRDVVLRGGSYQEIIDIAEEQFYSDLIVTDAGFTALAKSHGFVSGDPVMQQIRERGYHSAEILGELRRWGLFERYRATVDVVKNEPNTISHIGSTCGHWYYWRDKPAIGFVMSCVTDTVPEDQEYLFRQVIPILEATFFRIARQNGPDQMPYEPFLQELLGEIIMPRMAAMERAKALNIPYDGFFRLCVISCPQGTVFLLDRVRRTLAQFIPGTLSTIVKNEIVLFCRFADENDSHDISNLESFVPILIENGMTCGVSRVFYDLNMCNSAYQQAVMAIKFEKLLNEGTRIHDRYSAVQRMLSSAKLKNIYFYENVSVYQMIEYGLNEKREIFRTSPYLQTLKHLRQMDMENGTDYYDMFFAYLALERNTTMTAKVLNMNRTRLLYHLKKIEDEISLSLEDPNVRFNFLIAFRAMELLPSIENK